MGAQRFTPEFKEEAVRQITERGYSVADVSERLGVSAHSLYKWLRSVKPDNSGHQAQDLLDARTEILRLKAQLKRTFGKPVKSWATAETATIVSKRFTNKAAGFVLFGDDMIWNALKSGSLRWKPRWLRRAVFSPRLSCRHWSKLNPNEKLTVK
nr:transposase [Serratia symbiotica]